MSRASKNFKSSETISGVAITKKRNDSLIEMTLNDLSTMES